jgi:GT2 family glycosyltransferase
MLATCVESILTKTTYERYEVLIIDNNSEESATHTWFEEIQKKYERVKVLPYKHEFNFSAIVNYGVAQSTGEIVVLLNNDTEVINADWLTEMVSQCCRKEIGAVGAKLYYATGHIQHAGVFIYKGHPGNHIYLKREQHDPGYFNKLNLVQNYSAVTAACLAVRKELYNEVGGFDAGHLKIVYNDVDFCLKIRALGYRNLFTPFAQLFHYESQSRSNDMNLHQYPRFKQEHGFMLQKWEKALVADPFYNPNLNPHYNDDPSVNKEIVQLAFPPYVKYEWQENNIQPEQQLQ